jgi:uncharacterized protein
VPLVLACVAVLVLMGAALLTLLVWIGSERGIHPRRPGWQGAPPEPDLPVEPVGFCSQDGTRLAGWFVPGDRSGVVVLAHGYGSDRRELLPHAAFLYRAGYSLLLFDFRSSGQSEGRAVTIGALERLDLLGAVAYVRGRVDVGRSPIAVLGISLGAAVALLAAADSPAIAAVIAECPFTNLHSALARSFHYFTGLPAFPFAPLTVWLCERRLGIRARDVRPESAITRLGRRPVLLIHGLADTLIDPSNSRVLYERAGPASELWLVEAAAHARAYERSPDDYRARVLAFLERAFAVVTSDTRSA